MKVTDILRKLADKLDGMEVKTPDRPVNFDNASMRSVDVDNTDNTDPAAMVAPLQQELELMKKAAGVPNAFDSAEDDKESDCGCGGHDHDDHEHEHDHADADIEALKKMAGIKIVRSA
jgi:hypothetical protein